MCSFPDFINLKEEKVKHCCSRIKVYDCTSILKEDYKKEKKKKKGLKILSESKVQSKLEQLQNSLV